MGSKSVGAAEYLRCLGERGAHIDSLPEALRPLTRREGYEIQSILQSGSLLPLFGWKLAATSKAGQRHIGVDGPLIGRICGEQVIANGGTYTALEHNVMRVAELEFAFRFAADIEPESADIAPKQWNLLITDNACAHYFVLGEAAPDDWRTLDLAGHQPWGCIDGKRFRQGIGRNVLGDPRAALLWFLDEASRFRMTIHAGEIVTTGTCLEPMPISHGMAISGDFGTLGSVAVRIE